MEAHLEVVLVAGQRVVLGVSVEVQEEVQVAGAQALAGLALAPEGASESVVEPAVPLAATPPVVAFLDSVLLLPSFPLLRLPQYEFPLPPPLHRQGNPDLPFEASLPAEE